MQLPNKKWEFLMYLRSAGMQDSEILNDLVESLSEGDAQDALLHIKDKNHIDFPENNE